MQTDRLEALLRRFRVSARLFHSGPLCGVRGQIIRKAAQDYIVLRVHLIQQAVAVHIHADEIIPLN